MLSILNFILKIPLNILCLVVFLITGAFIRLLLSKQIYKQHPIDISALKPGDIILIGSNKNIDGWYIKISNILTTGITSKYWTHAAIHTGEGNLIEACREGIIDSTIKSYQEKGLLIKVLRHKYITDEKVLNNIIKFCKTKQSENYSYGIVGLIFYAFSIFIPVAMNFIFNNKLIDRLCNLDKAYFCSELVADAYKESGYKISKYDSWRIKPSDFKKVLFFLEIV